MPSFLSKMCLSQEIVLTCFRSGLFDQKHCKCTCAYLHSCCPLLTPQRIPPSTCLQCCYAAVKQSSSSFWPGYQRWREIFDLKGQGLWIKSPCKMIVKQKNRYADKLYLFADTAYSVLLQHVSPNISWMHQGYGRKSFISRISINLRTKIQYLLVEDKSTEERTLYWPCPDKISYTCTHNWIKNPGLFQQLYLTQSHGEEK